MNWPAMDQYDIIIVGAGIAGASLAAMLAPYASVLIIEAEGQPGYHATGRSAAFWTKSYGGPKLAPLTAASAGFLANPPPEYGDHPFMTARGALHIGRADEGGLVQAMLDEFAGSDVDLQVVTRSEIAGLVPHVGPEWQVGLWEPDCCDIDVAALHQACLRVARKNGAVISCDTALLSARLTEGRWHVQTGQGEYEAGLLVNAAGAWADKVAEMASVAPVGITPYRRTMVQLQVVPGPSSDLPLVVGLDGSFYFKPQSGHIWLSPHDEIESAPCDAAPEEIDVARAIDRFSGVVDWRIERLVHKWAGLRSFAPDRVPVIGRDSLVPQFFWFAGQGGFGIQTAPAAARLAASLIDSRIAPPEKVDPLIYDPGRFA